ncbi:ATP synthase subunit f, mitochondrial isoform X2 [Chiloscyllium plagiosum]|uniref:ATP synthase subunit f, mitochondrial isoform X2 n=1 Tax=Chiloscyllium plagiosum TaxID=36176 RepID=UPI001CB827BC|nr:ATP synthase subunit f, mitochondrial isoform X2 [Chiloscyllium plagiosum]
MGKETVPLIEKNLLDLKVKEVPSWTVRRLLSPMSIFYAICRCHDSYYKHYIDVKKGGLGGISMFLMGYVVISYIWGFSHIRSLEKVPLNDCNNITARSNDRS